MRAPWVRGSDHDFTWGRQVTWFLYSPIRTFSKTPFFAQRSPRGDWVPFDEAIFAFWTQKPTVLKARARVIFAVP